MVIFFFFFQAEDGIRDIGVTGVQTCALPICRLRPCGGPSTACLACRSRAKAARYAPTPRPSARCALPRLFAPPPPPLATPLAKEVLAEGSTVYGTSPTAFERT